jgi:hypothetical protein
MSPENDDLPPEIRARLRSLRRELAPGDLLEERVVRDLRARGLLQSRRPWFRPASWTARLAAGLLLFVSGWMVGSRWMAERPGSEGTPSQQGAVSAAELVEQAGDEFIQALTTVARQTPSEARDQGRDAALTSLRAAAEELSRIQEDDARLAQVILLLDEASGKSSRAPSEPNQVFWF